MDTIGARTGVPILLGGALLALVVAGVAGPAAAGTAPITSCNALITAPGTYVLANNLDCPSSGVGIQISASNVRLDLNGHAITGKGCSGTEVGILVAPLSNLPPLTGVKIEDGTVAKFCRTGIEVHSATGLRISDVTVSGNARLGITLASCPNCRVVDSRVSDNGAGIEVFSGSQGTRISDNVVSNNRSSGLIAAGTGIRLTDNVATGNGGNGAFDLFDNNPSTAEGCANTWRDNKFGSAGGPGAACIQ